MRKILLGVVVLGFAVSAQVSFADKLDEAVTHNITNNTPGVESKHDKQASVPTVNTNTSISAAPTALGSKSVGLSKREAQKKGAKLRKNHWAKSPTHNQQN